ncbi:MarR family winged helix-turn-helix transcriptional regulator [Bounagaea algeriensis]
MSTETPGRGQQPVSGQSSPTVENAPGGVAAGDESATDVAGTILAALDRLSRARRLHRQAVAAAQGLSTLQLELLSTLASGLPADPSVSALAREVGVAQPTATDSLQTLHRKGLVRYEPAAAGRHGHRVRLTPEGAHVVAEAERGDDAAREALTGLEGTQQTATLQALLSIVARFVQAGVITTARTCLTCHFHQRTAQGEHHCSLLGTDLAPAQLRLNCPEQYPHTPRA